ncbi:unnamed protein product [Somion occarium]|uniref:Uncharacterized protein n=1 Tax=Somion occarium TaxID=3059160 RepID=A0ABP1E3H7_9APHY
MVPKLELDVTSRQQVYGTRYSNVYRLRLQGGGDVCVKALEIVGDLLDEATQKDHNKRVMKELKLDHKNMDLKTLFAKARSLAMY